MTGSVIGGEVSFLLNSGLLQDGLFTLGATPLVPEPGTLALFGLAVGGMLGVRWLRRRA